MIFARLVAASFASLLSTASAVGQDSNFSTKDAMLENLFWTAQSYHLAESPYNLLSDCSLVMHLTANMLFNDEEPKSERTALKFMGLSGLFREASAIHIAQTGKEDFPASAFQEVVMQKISDDAAVMELATNKLEECKIALSDSSEKVGADSTSSGSNQ